MYFSVFHHIAFLKQVFQVKVQLCSKVRCLIFDNFFHFMLQLGFYVTSNSTSIQFSLLCRIWSLNLVLMCSLILSLNLVLMCSLIFSLNLVLMCSLIFSLNLVLMMFHEREAKTNLPKQNGGTIVAGNWFHSWSNNPRLPKHDGWKLNGFSPVQTRFSSKLSHEVWRPQSYWRYQRGFGTSGRGRCNCCISQGRPNLLTWRYSSHFYW